MPAAMPRPKRSVIIEMPSIVIDTEDAPDSDPARVTTLHPAARPATVEHRAA